MIINSINYIYYLLSSNQSNLWRVYKFHNELGTSGLVLFFKLGICFGYLGGGYLRRVDYVSQLIANIERLHGWGRRGGAAVIQRNELCGGPTGGSLRRY